MTTRAMGPLAALGWLKNAVNLGRNNPKAVFGGAALLLVTAVVATLAVGLLSGLVAAFAGSGLCSLFFSLNSTPCCWYWCH